MDPKNVFIDSSLFSLVESTVDQIEMYEYKDPKYKRHKCKLLKKVVLPQKEIDYMVRLFSKT